MSSLYVLCFNEEGGNTSLATPTDFSEPILLKLYLNRLTDVETLINTRHFQELGI